MNGRSFLGVALILAGCARPRAESAAVPCVAVPYSLASGTGASALAGAFDITLVATSGDSSGRQASGRLVLEPTHRSGAALVGRTDVPVERVSAFRVGQLDVSGDSAPGVLVMQRALEPASIMLRLGSVANALGELQPIEGAFTVLMVHRLDGEGFAGEWRSAVNLIGSSGHFCARRLP